MPAPAIEAPRDEKELARRLRALEEQMMEHAKNLDFEKAARLREELMALRPRMKLSMLAKHEFLKIVCVSIFRAVIIRV